MAKSRPHASTEEILGALQLNADSTMAEVGQRIKTPVHRIQYVLHQALTSGVARRGVYLDISKLGLMAFQLSLTTSFRSANQRAEFRSFLSTDRRVFWFGELGGRFHYGLVIYVPSAQDIGEFLDDVLKKFGDVVVSKRIDILVRCTYYRKKYLSRRLRIGGADAVSWQAGTPKADIDEVDLRILGALSDPMLSSQREIAQALKLARVTVDNRIKRLKKERVIIREAYFLSALKLGKLLVKIRVAVKGPAALVRRDLENLTLNEPNIVLFSELIGGDDFEIGIEVDNQSEVLAISDRLTQLCGANLSLIEVQPVFSQSTSQRFLRQT